MSNFENNMKAKEEQKKKDMVRKEKLSGNNKQTP